MLTKLKNWLEVRIGLDDLIRTQLKEFRVPKDLNIFHTLGFVTLSAYAVQLISGVLLLIYYIPHSDHAFQSVQHITDKVPYGWLFRQMHQVGSNLMIVALFLHVLFVFVSGSYKKPRELTWLTGGLMFLAVLAFCLTGYLLPWSQLSYWATTVVTTMPTAFPFLGDLAAQMLRGGEYISDISLTRFFALHVALLPLIFITFMIFHLLLVRRIGFSTLPFGMPDKGQRPLTEFRQEDYPDGNPFYPHFAAKAAYTVAIYLTVMFFIISFMPALFLTDDAVTPADPLKTPARIRPEWYFLAPYQMLKLMPNKFLGITIELLIVCLFLFWPFLDTKKERNMLRRPALLSVFIFSLALWFLLTIWGRY